MRKLIINADDFGLHPAVNKGIITGFVDGCITSTSIMPGGDAFLEAVDLALAHPKLGIGVHLMLVGGRTVSDPQEIPTLVDEQGCLPADYPVFLKRYLSGSIALDDIRRELTAQVNRVQAAGLSITHLDSHQHMHVVPGIIGLVLDIAERFAIRALRIPSESLLFGGGYPWQGSRLIARSGLTLLSWLASVQAHRRGRVTPDHFFGMLAGGNMQEEYLLTIIEQLPSGVSEIMVHPGADTESLQAAYSWQYHWQDELSAVTSPRVQSLLTARQVELVSFQELHYAPNI